MATTTTQTTLPAFLQDRLSSLIDTGQTISQRPYTPYGGPRIAAPTADTASSYAMTRGNVGSWQPNLSASTSLYGKAGELYNPADAQQFMNPYIDNVVNRIGDLGTRNLTEKILPNINSTFTGAGQFGSSRNRDLTSRAIRDTNESVLGQQGEALYNSQNASTQAYQTAMQRLLQSGQGLAQNANQQQTQQAADAKSLAGVGAAEQATTQQNYDLGYQDFLNQQQDPQNKLSWLSNLIYGNPMSRETTSTQSTPSPSTGSSIAQLAGLAGLNYFFKRGGKVKMKTRMA